MFIFLKDLILLDFLLQQEISFHILISRGGAANYLLKCSIKHTLGSKSAVFI